MAVITIINQVFKQANGDLHASRGEPVTMDTIAWWRMNCGRVMGIYDGRLIEYERSTLAPLGLVVGGDELIGRKVIVTSRPYVRGELNVVDRALSYAVLCPPPEGGDRVVGRGPQLPRGRQHRSGHGRRRLRGPRRRRASGE